MMKKLLNNFGLTRRKVETTFQLVNNLKLKIWQELSQPRKVAPKKKAVTKTKKAPFKKVSKKAFKNFNLSIRLRI